jgi:hypothetical protein
MITAVILIIIISFISYVWASGIEKMHRDFPDYKGDDFLDWDDIKDKL